MRRRCAEDIAAAMREEYHGQEGSPGAPAASRRNKDRHGRAAGPVGHYKDGAEKSHGDLVLESDAKGSLVMAGNSSWTWIAIALVFNKRRSKNIIPGLAEDGHCVAVARMEAGLAELRRQKLGIASTPKAMEYIIRDQLRSPSAHRSPRKGRPRRDCLKWLLAICDNLLQRKENEKTGKRACAMR
jgi:hypothetical protein